MGGRDYLDLVAAATKAKVDAESKWRRAILEAYVNGFSMIQIAEHAGITRESVRVMIRKAGL